MKMMVFFDHVPSPSAPSKDASGVMQGKKTTLSDEQIHMNTLRILKLQQGNLTLLILKSAMVWESMVQEWRTHVCDFSVEPWWWVNSQVLIIRLLFVSSNVLVCKNRILVHIAVLYVVI
jgi:hypothetical protein